MNVFDRLSNLIPGTEPHRRACEHAGRELVLKFRPELRGEIAARSEELSLLHQQDGKPVTPIIWQEAA